MNEQGVGNDEDSVQHDHAFLCNGNGAAATQGGTYPWQSTHSGDVNHSAASDQGGTAERVAVEGRDHHHAVLRTQPRRA